MSSRAPLEPERGDPVRDCFVILFLAMTLIKRR